jgi:hypothetical protein
MAVDYRRKSGRRERLVAADAGQVADEAIDDYAKVFDQTWRQELLDRAWRALSEFERATQRPYHTVLRFRSEHGECSSAEMAAKLTEQLRQEPPFSEAGIRKILQRARVKFADLLLDEVAVSIENEAIEAIEEELVSLDMLEYCRSAVARRRQKQA